MKKFFMLLILILPVLTFSQIKQKISKEKEYELLTKEALEDFWINSPLILQDKIIFFYRGTGKEKKVVIGGDFTEWQPLLLMEKKSTNMWQFVWEERLKAGEYRYRILVDDIWTSDPQNTNFIIDSYGEKISFFILENDFIPKSSNPLWIEKDVYEFKYIDKKANFVSLVGNFNNWNPFKHQMSSKEPGEFKIRIKLNPGIYVYCFVVDDKWTPDPKNLKQFRDAAGNIVSVFYVDKKNKSVKNKK